jgi:hypothetical protein
MLAAILALTDAAVDGRGRLINLVLRTPSYAAMPGMPDRD